MIKKLSIITVTKNRSKYLRLCLESLDRQSSHPWEIVVVDNASTDDTRSVVRSFMGKLPIVYCYTKKQGYPKIYNVGIKKATGDWIVFFDDDCIAQPNWLFCLELAIQKHPTSAIQGKTISIPRGNIYVDIMGDHYQNWIESNRLSKNSLRTFDNKNLCIPRSVIQKYGMFNEALVSGSEDIELGLRYTRLGVEILYDPSIVAFHHERDTPQGFILQHIRIARGEALVDRRVSEAEKVGVANKRKIILHLRSFLRRESTYLRCGEIRNVLLLPFLYGALAVIRLWTYYMTAWNTQK